MLYNVTSRWIRLGCEASHLERFHSSELSVLTIYFEKKERRVILILFKRDLFIYLLTIINNKLLCKKKLIERALLS